MRGTAQWGGADWADAAGFVKIDTYRLNILRAVELAEEHQRWLDVASFTENLRHYLLIYGYWTERLEILQRGYRAASHIGDLQRQGRFERSEGWTLVLMGRLTEAERLLRRAESAAKRTGDLKGEYDAIGDLAEVERLRNNLQLSRQLRQRSLLMAEAVGISRDVYVERTLLAQLDLQEGDIEAAKETFNSSLSQAEKLGWGRAIAYCHNWLGDTERELGNYSLARVHLRCARETVAPFNDRSRLALILKSDALLLLAEGKHDDGLRIAAEAIDELNRLGDWREAAELERTAAHHRSQARSWQP